MKQFTEDEKHFVTHIGGNLVNIILVCDDCGYEDYPLVEIKDNKGVVVTRENVSKELVSILLQLGNNVVMTDKE